MIERITVGITGASGSCYAERFIELAMAKVARIYVVMTKTSEQVIRHELSATSDKFSLIKLLEGDLAPEFREKIRFFGIDDLFAPIASGSSVADATIVVPCSMGTLARLATGMSTNLLERSADVALKQKRRLVVCPREAPYNTIHLKNMLALSQAGAQLLPLSPAFYQKPKSIADLVDFMVGRMFECIDLEHELYNRWNPRLL